VSAESDHRYTRRRFLGVTGATLAGVPALLAACGGDDDGGEGQAPAPDTGATEGAAAPARSGGRLRVGLVGGGTGETMDPHQPEGETSFARNHNHYELLLDFGPDGAPYEVLAEELSANADGSVWTVRLRDGIEFHNGKTLSAADVVYSYQRILDPELALEGANDLAFVKPENIRALDDLTVELQLEYPVGAMRDKLASRALSIFPDGFTEFQTQVIGTGPFRLESFTPGQRSLSVRFEHYHEDGKPLLDELELISIDDTAARSNALTAGQVDAIGSLDYSQVDLIEGAGFKILDAETGGFLANLMCVTEPPFDDPRVRLAVRLLHDREQLVNTIFFGHGAVGNDLGMRFDPIYASEIEQIAYDPERARALLAEAGQDGLAVELLTSNAYPGMLESATLFKEQAKAGGLNVELKQQAADAYYGEAWLAHPFKQTLWGQRSQDLFFLQALDSNAPYNETCWKRPEFDEFVREARATVDDAARRELYVRAQQLLWEEGGYVIWGHGNYTDAYSSKVDGFVPSAVRNLGWYTFKDVFFV
jgi:peptide/nickel transport system substrate-binding protein